MYDYILANLREYLDAVESQAPSARTISTSDGLPAVIKDVVAKDVDLVARVLDGADLTADAIDLNSVPVQAWPAVADHDAFPPTFANVRAYIDNIGEIDESLGRYLDNVGAIGVSDEVSEDEREMLAKEILSAAGVIPEPAARVGLVESLDLERFLEPSCIPAEGGPLIGLLIGNGVIEDNAESYRLAIPYDWSTKESAILASKEFMNYMTPAEMPIVDIPDLFGSEAIDSAFKDAVVTRFDEFIPEDDSAALNAAAEYASSSERRLTGPQIVRVAAAGADSDLPINLLALASPRMNLEELTSVLQAIGGMLKDLLARDGKHLKIDNKVSHGSILQRLEQLGEISSFKENGDKIEVFLKRS